MASTIDSLKKRVAYLERTNQRLQEKQVRQERLAEINRKLLKNSNFDLQKALRIAEQANKAKTDFLANISHEIRTPLMIILGLGEIIADTQLDTFQQKQLKRLLQAGQVLLEILNNVLELSSIDSGGLTLVKTPFSVDDLLYELQGTFTPLALAKGLSFSVLRDAMVVDCRIGDVVKIRQVLSNIVNNAIKFTETGKVNVVVTNDSSLQEGAGLVFEVIDTGIGIDKEHCQSVFSRFCQVTSDRNHQSGGVGLGLAICNSLVDFLGGSISMSSSRGVGSTFAVRLPLPCSDVTPLETTRSRTVIEPDSFPAMKVLVAEDVEENMVVIKHFLTEYPVELHYVTNGLEAISELAQSAFDLVLMDIRMPVMDGITAVRIIREKERRDRNIPIIAITAHAFAEQKHDYISQGFTEVLSKPFTKEGLLNTLLKCSKSLHAVEEKEFPGLFPERNPVDTSQTVPEALLPLIGEVIAKLQTYMAELPQSIGAGNGAASSEICHAARGLSGMYKLSHFSTLVEHISADIKEGNVENAIAVIHAAMNHLHDLQEKYKDYPVSSC